MTDTNQNTPIATKIISGNALNGGVNAARVYGSSDRGSVVVLLDDGSKAGLPLTLASSTSLSSVQGDLSTAQGNITDLQGKVYALQSEADKNKGDISTINSTTIPNIQAEADANKSDLTKIKTDFPELAIKAYVDNSVSNAQKSASADAQTKIETTLQTVQQVIENAAPNINSDDLSKASSVFGKVLDKDYESQYHAASTYATRTDLSNAENAYNSAINALVADKAVLPGVQVTSGQEVKFNTPFADTNYAVSKEIVDTASGDSFYQVNITKKTTTGVTFKILETTFDPNNGPVSMVETTSPVTMDIIAHSADAITFTAPALSAVPEQDTGDKDAIKTAQ